jgi:hypothetical protein
MVNRNFLQDTNHSVFFEKNKDMPFFAKEVTLPGISIGEIAVEYQNTVAYVSSNQFEFSALSITFFLAEDLSNYMYLNHWMRDMAKRGIYKDHYQNITIGLHTNNRTENLNLMFINCFPTKCGDITFAYEEGKVLTFDAEFRYNMVDYME